MVKERFVAKTFQTFKTVKRAFTEWKKDKAYIDLENFTEMMESWGFVNDCTELFQWLDHDKDGKISYSDLRATVGPEIAPMETFFFRQDV